ncbi:MAG: hypothetical protein ACKVQK_15820 [Burkholderiales bacterium]
MQPLDLRLTDTARAAIDKCMESLDYDECLPYLIRSCWVSRDGQAPREVWAVGAYPPDRVRFFEQLRANTGMEFFYKCDGVVLLLWQPSLAAWLHGRTLDYSLQRYVVI